MQETSRALARAALLFAVPMDEDQLRVYLHVLSSSGASDHRLAKGIDAACLGCKFMPKPADILEYLPSVEEIRKALPAADDDYIPPEDVEFNRAAFPLLNEYLDGKITRYEFLARLRWEAKKAGVEKKIAWQDFSGDTPWSKNGGNA
jgi:hypothetical protein